MSKKRRAFLHVGLADGSGDFIGAALTHHRHALAELGVRDPAESSEEMFRAALEMLRQHKAWGYRRSEVEGAWTSICRRGRKGKDTLVFSAPLLAGAQPAQIELLFDGLAGFERHVIITAAAPDALTLPGDESRDLGTVIERWGAAVRKPERLHLIVAPPTDQASTWKSIGRTVGFGTASLRLDELPSAVAPPSPRSVPAERLAVLQTLGRSWVEQIEQGGYDVVGELDALIPHQVTAPQPSRTDLDLATALREVERLTRRNETLELRISELERRRPLLRRLTEVA